MILTNILFNAVESTCGRIIFILPKLVYHQLDLNGSTQLMMQYEVAFVGEPTEEVTCNIRSTEFDLDVRDLSKKSYRYTPEKGKKVRFQKVIYIKENLNWVAPDFDKVNKDMAEMNMKEQFATDDNDNG
jgi:hypothetical protein